MEKKTEEGEYCGAAGAKLAVAGGDGRARRKAGETAAGTPRRTCPRRAQDASFAVYSSTQGQLPGHVAPAGVTFRG
eukprot:gene21045-biopygen14668